MRRTQSRWPLGAELIELRCAIMHRPGRAVVCGLCAVLLTWFVVSKSLPYALAGSYPGLARLLDPGQPAALLVLAERARARLLNSYRIVTSPPAELSSADGGRSGTGPANSPEAQDSRMSPIDTPEALRDQIRSLASRVLSADPLNAPAFRLLGEVSDDPTSIRSLMRRAALLSKREAPALFWLMHDSFEHQNIPDVVDKANLLLRTGHQLTPYVMDYLGAVAATKEGRDLLVALLAQNPDWRRHFFYLLPAHVQNVDVPFHLMLALRDAGSPATPSELAPYINVLIARRLYEDAYDAWLQLMPEDWLASASFLANADFKRNPSGLPFDWVIGRGTNAAVELTPLEGAHSVRALRLNFGTGRVQLPEVAQIILLPPGHFRLQGVSTGMISAKRGPRWSLTCLGEGGSSFQTEMLYGHSGDRQGFSLDIKIADGTSCKVQQLRLFHDARTPSEQLISGEMSFQDLRLVRLPAEHLSE